MTQFLPPNLLALFAAREPVRYLPPVDKLTHEKKRIPYSGVADYLEHFENPEDTPPPTKVLTKQEKLERKRREKAEQNQYKLEQQMALWNPQDNAQATTDPYKTLFVARINYDTSESKLRREFEAYGKIKQIKMVHDVNTGKPRGYAFIEYESEADMRVAYKRADGKKIDNRRVLVDVERGRTVAGWKPRRLGGEKGGRKSHNADGSSNGGILDSRRAPSMEVDERRDRDRDRERDRGDRNRDRGHDRDRGDRDRDRERDRGDRDRGDKDRGDKDRDRDRKDKDTDRKRSEERSKKRSRSRSKDKERRKRSKSKERHRSRSKERSKKSRRSRSRERNISATQAANTAVTAN